MKILLVGLSHKTAPVDLREQLAFPALTLRSALTHFDHTHSQAHLTAVKEGVILSTCNRLEVYALVGEVESAKTAVVHFLSRAGDVPVESFVDHLYIYEDEVAVNHLMRVAAGLDSLVLGEPQILGQITTAYEAALGQQAAGTVLSALFRAAIHAGKRARTETAIGVNAASISSVAAQLAGHLLGDLAGRRVLLIGAGEMGRVAVRSLMQRGATDIVVANRTYETAEALAQEWQGKAISFQQLPHALAQADIVITSTGAPHTILNKAQLAPVMAHRSARPLFLIDIAVPRDIDPDVIDLPHVHLHNIDDLQGQVEENVRERAAEVPRVEIIVAEEEAKFMAWYGSLGAVSTIKGLRQQAELWRQQELERLFNRIDVTDKERELIATMSHRLVNKLLHEPTLCLKRETANGNGVLYTSTVRHLFALDQPG